MELKPFTINVICICVYLFELYLMELKQRCAKYSGKNRKLWIVPNGIETYPPSTTKMFVYVFELYLMELKLSFAQTSELKLLVFELYLMELKRRKGLNLQMNRGSLNCT